MSPDEPPVDPWKDWNRRFDGVPLTCWPEEVSGLLFEIEQAWNAARATEAAHRAALEAQLEDAKERLTAIVGVECETFDQLLNIAAKDADDYFKAIKELEARLASLQAERDEWKTEHDEVEALIEAFDDGQAAALKGFPASANPHDPGDSSGVPMITQLWDDGYICCSNKVLRTRAEAAEAALASLQAQKDAITQERDTARAELHMVDMAIARRPALDRATRAGNIEHACNVAQQMTDKAHRLERELADLRAQLPQGTP